MRILGVRWEPVARVLAIIYGLFGVGAFCLSEFTRASQLTLPFGVVAPVFHLSFNLNVPRPDGVFSGVMAGVAEILAYAVTGWITGAVAALGFNIVCRRLGGIDAKYVSIANENDPVN
jgi:TM2 domain-containing membrane protein YozV